jgi:hypothetical protein
MARRRSRSRRTQLHKSHDHDHGKPGTPPWLISFGDMMTLFLCFFIMLVTMAKTQDAGLMANGPARSSRRCVCAGMTVRSTIARARQHQQLPPPVSGLPLTAEELASA